MGDNYGILGGSRKTVNCYKKAVKNLTKHSESNKIKISWFRYWLTVTPFEKHFLNYGSYLTRKIAEISDSVSSHLNIPVSTTAAIKKDPLLLSLKEVHMSAYPLAN